MVACVTVLEDIAEIKRKLNVFPIKNVESLKFVHGNSLLKKGKLLQNSGHFSSTLSSVIKTRNNVERR